LHKSEETWISAKCRSSQCFHRAQMWHF